MTANTTSTSNSVITRKSQRPLSIRKEIGRSRCENLLLPLTPRSIDYSDDEVDGSVHSVADSGMGSETSVSCLKMTKMKIYFPDYQYLIIILLLRTLSLFSLFL